MLYQPWFFRNTMDLFRYYINLGSRIAQLSAIVVGFRRVLIWFLKSAVVGMVVGPLMLQASSSPTERLKYSIPLNYTFPIRYAITIQRGEGVTGTFLYYAVCYTQDSKGTTILADGRSQAMEQMTPAENFAAVPAGSFPAVLDTMDPRKKTLLSNYIYLFVSTDGEELLKRLQNQTLDPLKERSVAKKRIPYKPGCLYDEEIEFTVTKKKLAPLSISVKDKRTCTNKVKLLKESVSNSFKETKKKISSATQKAKNYIKKKIPSSSSGSNQPNQDMQVGPNETGTEEEQTVGPNETGTEEQIVGPIIK